LYFVGAVPGLALQVKTGSARSWILRLVIGNKRRDMGLGAYPSVSLAHARQKASEARELVRQRGLSQEALALDAGIQRNYVSLIERRKRHKSAHHHDRF